MMIALLILALPAYIFAPASLEEVTSEKLGSVHFPVSCNPAAQQQFDRALAMLHSFWYPPDLNAFREVTKTDPACAMGYWGIAISRRANPLVAPPDPPVLKDGLDAITKAKAIGAKTQRERDYIAALETYYADWEKRNFRIRVLDYEKAMEKVYRTYPEDPEAAVFYALALNEAAMAGPHDMNYTRQLKAAGILEKVLEKYPDHPGALHYLIHSYDYPPLAERALAAAQRYGGVAPSAPHALHMPSHVYSMLGMWQDSIRSNQNALSVAEGYAHALDFMTYAYLQGAQDGEAKRAVERCQELRKKQVAVGAANPTGAVLAGYTALAAIPARYVLERGAWADASRLEVQPTTPIADSITYFTRAMGSGRSGKLQDARNDIENLREIEDGLKKSDQEYWAEQVSIQRNAANAWVEYAEGRKEEAVKLMRMAADMEDASEKHIAMENRLWPMRELLGELLLAMNQPAQALTEFEHSLQFSRNRYRGFYGAAKAAEQSGNVQQAKTYYSKLVALCANADTQRPELTEAKTYLARN